MSANVVNSTPNPYIRITPIHKPPTKEQNKLVKKPKEEQDSEPSKAITKIDYYA